MNLDFFLVVHDDPAHSKPSRYQWDPRPVPGKREDCLPNLVCAWVDPFWSGLTCERIGDPIRSPPPLHDNGGGEGGCCGVVFRIKGTIQPLKPSTAQSLCMDYHFEKTETGHTWPSSSSAQCVGKSMANSLKLHFMRVVHETQRKSTKTTAGVESVISDFLYSSAIPLDNLLLFRHQEGEQQRQQSSSSLSSNRFGLFNYNHDFDSAEPVPGFYLILSSILEANPPTAGDGGGPAAASMPVIMQPLAGPTPKHHERVVELCEWVCTVLGRIQPNLNTTFRNMRTLLRDRGSCHLFQHLPFLFDTPGTYLPLTLGPYGLMGALAVNGGIPPLMLSEDIIPAAYAEGEDRPGRRLARRLLMRILRDTVACFTLCAIEGVYWPDISLDADVEDQPFPGGFTPAARFFPKDDCEGGAARAQQVMLLLRTMHQIERRVGFDTLLARIRAMPSFASLFPLAPLNGALLLVHDLTRACCDLGGLLEADLLDVQTIVGDVRVPSLAGMAHMDANTLYGHSFSVGIFRDREKEGDGLMMSEPITAMIETTGWQRSPLYGYDVPLSEEEKDALPGSLAILMQDLAEHDPRCRHAFSSICSWVGVEKEDFMYQNLTLGRDRIYFTFLPDGSTRYGASFHDMRKGVAPFSSPSFLAKIITPGGGGEPKVCYMSTAEFIQALHPGAPNKPPGWPSDPDAPRMLQLYNEIHASIPEMRRCLRPPPRSEEDYERIMRTRWSGLPVDDSCRLIPSSTTEATAAATTMPLGTGVAGFYFSIPALLTPSSSSLQQQEEEQQEEEGEREATSMRRREEDERQHRDRLALVDSLTRDVTEALYRLLPSPREAWAVRSMPFMSSIVFNVRSAA